MTPEPTVLPPSRMAKWLPMSRATGLSRLTATRGVVARHHHLDPVRQTHFAGDVRGPEEELRLVTAEERRVPSAFVLAQDVNLTLELLPGPDRARSGDHLATLDLVGLDASQQQADVLSSFALSPEAG